MIKVKQTQEGLTMVIIAYPVHLSQQLIQNFILAPPKLKKRFVNKDSLAPQFIADQDGTDKFY